MRAVTGTLGSSPIRSLAVSPLLKGGTAVHSSLGVGAQQINLYLDSIETLQSLKAI